MSAPRRVLLGLSLLACALPGSGTRRQAEIEAQVAALARAGFEFEADVGFAYDMLAACDGLACADVRVISHRRTIVVAREAFASRGRLRLTLLEVWERYRTPRAGPARGRDLARGLLRVLRDGERAGIDDRKLLRLAHVHYEKQYARLEGADRRDLPRPGELPYP